MFSHVVMFKLKDKAACDETVAKLRSLDGKVPSLRHIEVGQDVLQTGRSFDIVLITKFDDLAGMQAYQVHPHHVTVVEHMHRVAETAVSVDYED
jgi:hypothetical protein